MLLSMIPHLGCLIRLHAMSLAPLYVIALNNHQHKAMRIANCQEREAQGEVDPP